MKLFLELFAFVCRFVYLSLVIFGFASLKDRGVITTSEYWFFALPAGAVVWSSFKD